MAERDAFGREIGEDSLAAMGWSGSAAPAPARAPAPAPVATAPAPSGRASVAEAPIAAAPPRPAPPAAPPARRRRRRHPFLRLLIPLAFIALAFGAGVFNAGRDAVDQIKDAIDDATQSVTPAPAPAASLLGAAPLKAALAKLPPGRVMSLRVAPERIDAQVYSDGRMHVVQVTAGGRVSDVRTPVAVQQPKLTVHPAAPLRIARATGHPVGDVNYLVLAPGGWELFLTDGTHYHANALGRHVKQAG